MKHPHQNVTEYYGYVGKDSLMAGLCFKQYGQTLGDVVEKETLKVGDIEFILEQIEKGIQHIHSLGLMHVSFHSVFCFIEFSPHFAE